MNHPKTNKTFHKPIYCRAKANTSMEWSRIELLEGYTSPAHAQLIQQIQYKFNEELSAQQKDFPDDDDDDDQSKDSRDTQYSLFCKDDDDADDAYFYYYDAHNDYRYDDYNNYENNNCDDDADNDDDDGDDDDDSCASSYSFMDELRLLTKQVVYRTIHHSFHAVK